MACKDSIKKANDKTEKGIESSKNSILLLYYQ